mgnify:FL=1|jgi:methyl-accepting chemotaxis protein
MNFDYISKLLGNTKLIIKSVLDLVPALIVAIVVAVIASYGMNSLNNNFESILDKEAELTSKIKSATKALNDWQNANTDDFVLAVKQENKSLLQNASNNAQKTKITFETLFGDVEYLINEIYAFGEDQSFDNNTSISQEKVIYEEFNPTKNDLMKSIYLDLQRGKNLIQNVIPKQTKGISFAAREAINTAELIKRVQTKANQNKYKLNASIIDSLKAGNKVLLVIDDSIILRKIQDYNNFLTDLIKKFSLIDAKEKELFAINYSSEKRDLLGIELLKDIDNIKLDFENIEIYQEQIAYLLDMQTSAMELDTSKQFIVKALNEYLDNFSTEAKKIDKYFAKYLNYMNRISLTTDDKGKTSFEPGSTIFATDWVQLLVDARDILDKQFNDTITILAWLEKYANAELDNAREANITYLNSLILIIIIVSVVGLSIAIGIGYLVAFFGIVRPMRQFASVSMEIVKTGNFSKTIDIKNNDEIGEAANAFNLMVSNTKEAFTEIEGLFSKVAEGDLTARIHKEFRGDIGRSAAHISTSLQKLSETFKGLLVEVQRMASASSQVENAISQVADGAKEQLSATQEISQQMQENSDISNDVNEKARNTSDMAREAAKISDHGKLESVEMMRVVEKIENNSEEIGKISDLIDEIAQQTNMLSLNASIEAARAGEQGRGFSVVATEVGKLAERSGSSVKDISELTEVARNEASGGAERMKELKEEMEKISETINSVEKMMLEIVNQSNEQKDKNTNVQNSISNLTQIGENNSVAAEEISASMIELSNIANNTKNKVSEFKLDNEIEIKNPMNNHKESNPKSE